MATRARRHVHKYYRANFNGNKIWCCALPDCSHYMPLHMQDMVNGKFTICWECGNQTLMTPMSMKEDMPRCDDCRLGISHVEPEISEVLNRKMTGEAEPMTDTAKRIAEFLERQKT